MARTATASDQLVERLVEWGIDTVFGLPGFSCASQIEQLTDRGALHLAQVIQMALHEGPNGPPLEHPENRYSAHPNGQRDGHGARAAAVAGAALAGLGLMVRRRVTS